LYLKKKKT